MDYRRAYWLLFLGAGLLFGLLRYLDYAAGGAVTLWTGLAGAVAVLVVALSAYAAANPERAGGPEAPNARFAVAALAFLLLAALVVERLLVA